MSGFQIPKSVQAFFASKSLKKRFHARTVAGRAAKRKTLLLESLERRELMAADVVNPIHNSLVPQDVNGDFTISPIDVLQVINAMNRQSNSANGEGSSASTTVGKPMADVNNDGFISPIDALMVINRLRTGEGVGELAEVGVEVRNASGTALTPTIVGGVAEYTVGLNENFTVRTRTRDMRADASGVFSTYVDIGYATQGSPTTELAQVQWGEYQSLRFSSNTNGGTFTLTFGSETTAAITYSANDVNLRNNIRNAVGALAFVGGVNNVRTENFQFEGSSDRGIGISFINSLFRTDVANVSVGANNLTSNDTNPATIQTSSTADPANRNVLGAAITYPLNTASGGATFNFTSGRNEGSLVTVPNTRLLLDNVGNFTGAQPALDDGTVFLNVFDTAFRSSGTAGVVDFTVGPTGDTRLGVGLFGSDVIIPDNQVDYPEPFRIRFETAAVGVNADDDTFAVLENSGANNLTVLANDDLLTGTTLTVTAVTQPASGGSVAIANSGSSVTFTPTAGFSGTAQFTYTVSNGLGNSDSATVTVNVGAVNDPPVAVTTPINVAEDSAATNITPSQLFTPGPGEDTQVVTLSDVAIVPGQTGGTVSLQGGNVVFTPSADFNGNVLFTAKGTDNGTPNAATTGTFTVTVTPVNDAPTATSMSISTNEDTSININASQLFTPGPSDESAQTLTFFSATPDGTQAGGSISVVGGQAAFVPTPNFNGTFVFVGVARDNGSPNADSQPSTITITVNPVNDDPIAVDDTGAARFTVQPGSSLNALDVMANDNAGPNEPGDTITILSVTNPQGPGTVRGTISVSADKTRVIYTPPAGLFNASETFTYTIQDTAGRPSTASAEVFIAEPPKPFAVNDLRNVEENSGQLSINVLANDLFNTGATRLLVGINANSVTPSNGGTIVLLNNGTPLDTSDDTVGFTPTASFSGNVTFTYQMTDTAEGSVPSTGTVTVQVGEFNDPPTAQNKSGSTNEDTPFTISKAELLAGATTGGTGEESQILKVVAASVVTSGAGTAVVNSDESITFTPAANFNGPVSVQYTIEDNGTTGGQADPKRASATISITVTPVNDAPVPTNDDASTPEDTPLSITLASLTANDSAGPSNESTQTLTVISVAMVDNTQGTISIVGSNAVFQPAANFNGTALATYVVRDNGSPTLQATGTITINVTAVNDAPVPVTASRSAFVSLPLTIDLTQELAQASRGAANESSQTVRVNRVIPATGTNATRGTVTLNNDGTIRYVAPTDITAQITDVFDYEITDNGTTNGSADPKTGIARVSVVVNPFQSSEVTGRIWIDDNNSGTYDRNELFVDGVQVVLSGQPLGAATRSDNLGSARTFSDGSFSFGNLSPGSYTVSFVRPTFLLDAPEVEQLNFTIDAPGGSAVTTNFRVLGISNVTNALWENQLNGFYLRNGQEWAYRGFTALVNAEGAPIWNIQRGGFEGYDFNKVSLDVNSLTPTVVSEFLHTIEYTSGPNTGKLQDVVVSDTYTVSRGQFLITRVEGGNFLIRILALPNQLAGTRSTTNIGDPYDNPSGTPAITAEGFGYSSVDSVFANDEWDD